MASQYGLAASKGLHTSMEGVYVSKIHGMRGENFFKCPVDCCKGSLTSFSSLDY